MKSNKNWKVSAVLFLLSQNISLFGSSIVGYPKIYEVLPKDIILQIQDYIEGEVIYIPKRSENKKSWGDCTDTKEILSLRNKKIYYDYCDGISVQQLAQKYFLAEKSIQRIIRYEKNNR